MLQVLFVVRLKAKKRKSHRIPNGMRIESARHKPQVEHSECICRISRADICKRRIQVDKSFSVRATRSRKSSLTVAHFSHDISGRPFCPTAGPPHPPSHSIVASWTRWLSTRSGSSASLHRCPLSSRARNSSTPPASVGPRPWLRRGGFAHHPRPETPFPHAWEGKAQEG